MHIDITTSKVTCPSKDICSHNNCSAINIKHLAKYLSETILNMNMHNLTFKIMSHTNLIKVGDTFTWSFSRCIDKLISYPIGQQKYWIYAHVSHQIMGISNPLFRLLLALRTTSDNSLY